MTSCQEDYLMQADPGTQATTLPREPELLLVSGQGIIAKAVVAGGGVVKTNPAQADGVIAGFDVNPDELEAVLHGAPGVKWVQLARAGVEAFLPLILKNSQISWTSAKGCYAKPVAEHALALTLALLRHLPRRAQANSWSPAAGISLHGTNVLVVGGGGIAHEVVRLMKSFSTHVTVVRRSQKAVDTADLTIDAPGLHRALRTADVVILAAALTAESKGMISTPELALLRPNAILVNVSRGELVDTDALVVALKAGTILGAGLDVTDPEPLSEGHPLWREPRALITPHTADTMEMRVPHYVERVSENVRQFAFSLPLNGRVDPNAGY